MRSLSLLPRAALLALTLSVTSGCLARMPPTVLRATPYVEQIQWSSGFEGARQDALALQRPMIVFLVAGELEGFC